jgi:hypothetical protein
MLHTLNCYYKHLYLLILSSHFSWSKAKLKPCYYCGGGGGVDLWASVAVAIHLTDLGGHELWGMKCGFSFVG